MIIRGVEYMISVAMCTYNGQNYIIEQLKSIVEQDRMIDEIVICDDCSKDKTVELAKRYLNKTKVKYKILINDRNLGVEQNFRKCIESCKGEYIFLADQDDVWLPDKVKRIMEKFEDNENCMLVACDGHIVNKDLQIMVDSSWESFNAFKIGFKGSKTSKEEFIKLSMYHWFVSGTMMAVRRKLIEHAFPEPTKAGWIHDNWLVAIAPIYGDVAFVDEKLVLYRQHDNNTIGASVRQRTNKGKSFYHVQHVLFHFHIHYDRLNLLMEYKEEDMSYEYKKIIAHYQKIYKKNKNYIQKSNVHKFLILIGFIICNSLKDFNITRKDIIYYLYNQFAKNSVYMK